MRRLISSLLVLGVLSVAGCGGSDDSGSSALDAALSYLPKNSSVAIAFDTNVDGGQYGTLRELLDKFPFGDQAGAMLKGRIEQSGSGIRFDEDVKPVLGNPLVIGAPSPEAVTGDRDAAIGALKAKDKGALDDLVAKMSARKIGEASGATLYMDGDTPFAVEGDMLTVATDERLLKAALERSDGDDHFDEESFDKGLEGLPDNALARVYADVGALLRSDPGSADALKIKWVGALRTLGLTATARSDAVDVDFRIRTDGDLSDTELPIAPGDEAPPVVERPGEIGLGIRDLAHIVRFAEDAAQSVDPAGFGDYEQAKRTIDTQLGVNLDDDLIGQLTGNVSASVALDGAFGVRAELKDPPAFERTLAKVADVLPSFAEGAGFGRVALSKPSGSDDFYELRQAGGGSIVFGVSGDVLIVARDRGRARELASAGPAEVPDSKGSVVVGADAERLVGVILRQFGSSFGVPDLGGLGTGLLTRPLDQLSGSMSASSDELRGKLTLSTD
jgi:hypothetical protein